MRDSLAALFGFLLRLLPSPSSSAPSTSDRQAPKSLLRSPLAILTTSVPDTTSYSALGVGMHGDPGLAWGILRLGWRRI
jgi:hypothetical protein